MNRNSWTLFFLLIVFSSCNVSNSDEKVVPLEFDEMLIQYHKFGGWINTSQLDIQSSGEATATVRSQASSEVLHENISVLTELQKEELARSFASFSNFERHYQPKEHWTDQNYYLFILTYKGSIDTVSVYNPSQASLPKDLKQLIAEVEEIHQSIINEK